MDLTSQYNENEAGTLVKTKHRGLCPVGWHVPTQKDFNRLYDSFALAKDYAGTYLKSTSGWEYSGNGSDRFGFSALPAGSRSSGGKFGNLGYHAFLWSASELNSYRAYYQRFDADNANVYQNYDFKGSGFSLRCLQDSN